MSLNTLRKVLVANRGEIAVRIIRTCRELGIETVAVYSELDRNAAHVRLADEAYALGGQTAAESYLNVEAIIDVIERSGADAVHPGYGFLAENADFARSCKQAGAVFIGPEPEAIEIMGDKISARHAARKAGVDGVPGTIDPVNSAREIVDFGNKYGWPVAIKAAFGGGGRGMKVVYNPDSAQSAFESAQREATAYFGRPEAYVERYLTWPRHVEMQIFGDTHGNYVWIGERDCSVQRRHQKLVEESPAPDLSDKVRKAMGEASVKIAKACGYVNAGTVEFLYQDGDFYFLEMNTRLQVEHPVTEMVTGIDFVELQLRIAAGEKLGFSQSDIERRGHAIELRVNAEDPTGGAFRPSPGKITTLRTPNGFGVRFDLGYDEGDTVSQYYDNLVGKLICWGPTRDVARQRALRALRETRIEGIATTLPAHERILRHHDFAHARHSTTWAESRLDLADLPSTSGPSIENDSDEQRTERTVDVEVNGKRFSVRMWIPEGGPSIAARAEALLKKAQRRPGSATSGSSGGASSSAAPSGAVTVPMQGTVVRLNVSEGDVVEAGQTICVLEAMKMENNVAAPTSGTVHDLRVSEGAGVGPGDTSCIIHQV